MRGPPIEILQSAWKKKKEKQPKFSLRQLAAKVGVSAPFLSQVLNGKRPLPPSLAVILCRVLDVQKEKRDYILSVLLEKKGIVFKVPLVGEKETGESSDRPNKWNFVTDRNFWALSEWYYLPILNCTMLKDYDGSIEFIASHLDLPIPVVGAALDRLKEGKLLEERDGRLVKSNEMNDFHSGVPRSEIRKFHSLGMDRAQAVLREKTSDEDLEKRLITSMVFTVSEEDVAWVKQQIADLMSRVSHQTQKGSPQKVYHLGVQLFPHSRDPH